MLKNNINLNGYKAEDNKINFYIHKDNYDGSNFDFLKNKMGWNYENIQEYNVDGKIDYYICISFEYNRMTEEYKNAFIDSLKLWDNLVLNNDEIKYSNMFKQLFNTFGTNKKRSEVEKLHGDIGEALFILKLLEIGYSPEYIKESIRSFDGSTFDFAFKLDNNQTEHIEIKSCSFESDKIKLQQKQSNLDNSNIVVVKVNYYEKETTILDLYNEISKNINIDDSILQTKKFHYETSDKDFIESHTIKLDDNQIAFNFYNKDFIPEITIKNEEALNKIILELKAGFDFLHNESFEGKLNLIIPRK